MQLELLNEQGQATAKVDAPDTVFARDYNEALVHQVVVAFQANARQGTRAQLDRTMVKHSTKKPWRQKGTGRARAGMTSSPLWRGGGRIFPNSPDENFVSELAGELDAAGVAFRARRDGSIAYRSRDEQAFRAVEERVKKNMAERAARGAAKK